MDMTSRVVRLLLVIMLFAGCVQAQQLGEPLSLSDTTPISEILAHGDAFVGKRIQVKGVIVDVCARRGCWMYLAGDKPFEKLRFKVTDGEIVIPMEARGQMATAEGVVQRFDLTREQVIEQRRHHAEETGQSFDPESVTSGETFYQLRGLAISIPSL